MLSPTKHELVACPVCVVDRLGIALHFWYVIYKIVEEIITLIYLAILLPLMRANNQLS